MSKYTLTYEKDKSQEIYIEEIKKIGKDESLYFNKEYEDSLNLIKAIVDAQIKNGNNANYSCNNRILFTGQRGSGKTSVMRSLAKYLSNEKIIVQNSDETVVKFSCLPMVDPSHFDNNNNILLTVITNMFSEAKKKMNKEKDGGDTAKREDLLKQFEKVFKSLDSIKSELSSYTLESLNRKSDAEDLKDKMKDLVQKYLTFQGCGGDQSRLVLLIDDIDMSVSYAPEMLEQLRKYLELDNLIILMSANLGQLTNEMREKYSSAFQYTLKDSNQALSIDVEDLATKYLLKLFPTSRRINVERHVEQLLKTNLVVEGWNDQNKTDNTNTKDDESQDEGDFQKVILSLIWSKTRLLFIPKDPENTLHPIIPTNLRDLAQFLDMLTSLNKIEPKEDNLFKNFTEYSKCKKNLQVFKDYVMNTWIPNHLNVEEELVFHNIPADITEINKHLINSINVIGTKHKKDMMSREVGLDMIEKNAVDINIDRDIYTMVSPNDPKFVKANKISDIFNQPSNYSYGDLLLMIDKYETYFESEEHRKFTDAIKIYYSILLFETMFFKSTKVVYDFYGEIARRIIKDNLWDQFMNNPEVKDNTYINEIKTIREKSKLSKTDKSQLFSNLIGFIKEYNKKDCIHQSNKVLAYSKMPQVIPIQELIGGTVYYPNYFEIITDKNFNQKGPSFDAKRAFYHKVEVDNSNKVGEAYPLFAVLYYGDIRPDRYEKDHIYDTTFDKNADIEGVKYVTFDILSVLNNMLNPCHTLSRLDNVIYRPNKWNNIVESVDIWGQSNRINEVSIPNAILPFYSVDIMLHYLAQSYTAYEVNNSIEEEAYSEEKELIKKGKKLFFHSVDDVDSVLSSYFEQFGKNICVRLLMNSTLDTEIKQSKIENIKKDDYKNSKLDSEICREKGIDVSDYNEKIDFVESIHTILAKKEKKIQVELNDKFVNNSEDKNRIIASNIRIIEESKKKYNEIVSSGGYMNNSYSEIIQELYRNSVISSILEHYQGSKKDMDGLIKDLRKFTTISEIYKHLVEVLWENAITELLIRSDIQEKVREPNSVKTYYDFLWEETQELLKTEDIPLDTYKKIYNSAKDKFLS